MSYSIKSVTIRANNSPEGMAKISLLWQDVMSGKLPVIFDSEQQLLKGISPISRYSNYASDERGDYDLSILGVRADFFTEMESLVKAGKYAKYDEAAGDLESCAQNAWSRVWNDQKNGIILRAYTQDYESTVPAMYTKDGNCHCYLYISIK